MDGGAPASGTGAVLWQRELDNGAGRNAGAAVAFAPDGDVLLASTHEGGLPDFGGGPQPSRGQAAVSRYSAGGGHRWTYALQLPEACGKHPDCYTTRAEASQVAVDAQGRVGFGALYAERRVRGDLVIRAEMMLAVLEPDGQRVRWQRKLVVSGALGELQGMGFDAAGNLTVSGYFVGAGPDFGDGRRLGVRGQPSTFVARYSPEGRLLWAHAFGSARGYSRDGFLAVEPDGGFVLAGRFVGRLGLGGEELVGPNDGAVPGLSRDLPHTPFVARFDPDGSHRWSRALASPDIHLRAVAVGSSGVALGGWFNQPTTFGGRPLEPVRDYDGVTFNTYGEGVVALLSPEGEELWARAFGDLFRDYATAVAVTPGGDVVVGGKISGAADLGGPELGDRYKEESLLIVGRLRGTDGAHVWSREVSKSPYEQVAVAAGPQGQVAFAGEHPVQRGTCELDCRRNSTIPFLVLAP